MNTGASTLSRLPLLTAIALTGVLATWAVLAAAWRTLPSKIPMHMDLSGQVNAYGSRWEILVWPVLATAVFALLSLVQRYPHAYHLPVRRGAPHRLECERLATGMVRTMNALVCWMFVPLALRVALQPSGGTAAVLSVCCLLLTIAVLVAVVGVSLVRMQRLAA